MPDPTHQAAEYSALLALIQPKISTHQEIFHPVNHEVISTSGRLESRWSATSSITARRPIEQPQSRFNCSKLALKDTWDVAASTIFPPNRPFSVESQAV